MFTELEIKQQIQNLERQLADLKREENYKRFTPIDSFEKHLAVLIHEKTCTQNHANGCGWYYEIDNKELHDWTANSHSTYLKIAYKLHKEFDMQLADYEKFFDILKGK